VFLHALFAVLFLPSFLSIQAVPLRIACIGDSITEGSGLGSPSVESYPARLQRILGTNDFTVRNFGVSGRTLLKRGDFPYWKETAFTNSRTFNPDIVIIQLGTNDGKPYNWIYGTNFVSDYKEMIAIYAALSASPRVYLCTPCPVYGAGAYDINPGTIRTNIVPKVRDLATELTLQLIDLNARMTNSLWFPDTVHPNSKGMAAMAAVMFENLAGGLPQEPPPVLIMERVTATKIILSWPAQWGALVPEMATVFPTNRNRWSILETVVPSRDGTMLRQTNSFANVPLRLFQLSRP
jgi:acyl-CoA thioesterase I